MGMQETLAFGPHLTVDLEMVPFEIQSDMLLHYNFLYRLPELIGMTRIELPRVFPYSGMVPEDRGITGICVIAESHLSAHSFECKGWTFVDVFSCKFFKTDICLEFILDTFKPGKYAHRVVQRGIGFPR